MAESLRHLFPGSTHVHDCGLGAASDEDLWRFAKEKNFAIISKDSDFYDRGALYGSPPKVLWLRVGNCTTEQVEDVLQRSKGMIEVFESSAETTLVIFASPAPG